MHIYTFLIVTEVSKSYLWPLHIYSILLVGMGDMGLKIYHDISVIYCDNDINDDNSGNPVSL